MCRELYIVSVYVVVWATHLEPGDKLLATAGTMASGSLVRNLVLCVAGLLYFY